MYEKLTKLECELEDWKEKLIIYKEREIPHKKIEERIKYIETKIKRIKERIEKEIKDHAEVISSFSRYESSF